MSEKFIKSVRHAIRGLVYAFRHEQNFRIETLMGVLVVGSLFLLDLENWEKVVLLIMVGWVIVMELLNTVIERVVNIVQPRSHPYPGVIKDIMASVVLISSLTALCVAVFIVISHGVSVGI